MKPFRLLLAGLTGIAIGLTAQSAAFSRPFCLTTRNGAERCIQALGDRRYLVKVSDPFSRTGYVARIDCIAGAMTLATQTGYTDRQLIEEMNALCDVLQGPTTTL